jgi:hypothetical protein
VVSLTRPERITVLAGAGLSADAGVPTSILLAQKLKAALREEYQAALVRGDRSSVSALYLPVFNLLNGAIRFQLGSLNRDPEDSINIEQIAVAALELLNRLESPLAPYVSGWHQRINDLERVQPSILTSFVEAIYGHLSGWLKYDKITDLAYIARLTDLAGEGSGVDLFTLNYDLCIEAALFELAKRPFVNGFTESGWDASQFDKSEVFRVYKLHGSLDWVDDEAYGPCALQFPRHKDADDISPQRPLLIFGTPNKLTAREPFLTLAYQFLRSVLATPLLVIIGYGFGDEYVNDIIDQGIRSNPRLRIIVVSPQANARIATRPMLKGAPRVHSLERKARDVLQSSELLLKVREILKDRAEELPF